MDMTVVGKKLVELRGERSQAQVASDLNISDAALSAYELGVRIPRDEVKLRIAEYYGTSVGELFFNSK